VKVVESVRPEADKTPKRMVSGKSKSPIRERKRSETEVEVERDGMKELHVTLSPRTPAGDPPEPEELIKALLVRGTNSVKVAFNVLRIAICVMLRCMCVSVYTCLRTSKDNDHTSVIMYSVVVCMYVMGG
jgi:hypothetical protein